MIRGESYWKPSYYTHSHHSPKMYLLCPNHDKDSGPRWPKQVFTCLHSPPSRMALASCASSCTPDTSAGASLRRPRRKWSVLFLSCLPCYAPMCSAGSMRMCATFGGDIVSVRLSGCQLRGFRGWQGVEGCRFALLDPKSPQPGPTPFKHDNLTSRHIQSIRGM